MQNVAEVVISESFFLFRFWQNEIQKINAISCSANQDKMRPTRAHQGQLSPNKESWAQSRPINAYLGQSGPNWVNQEQFGPILISKKKNTENLNQTRKVRHTFHKMFRLSRSIKLSMDEFLRGIKRIKRYQSGFRDLGP